MADDPVVDGAGGAEDREGLADGVEHLQVAAREVIRAGRSLLDAAEGLIEDPAALHGLAATLGTLAQAAVRTLGNVAAGAAGATDPGDGDDDEGKVQRITLS